MSRLTITSLTPVELHEYERRPDPRPLLRYDGTSRSERISGAILWPILMLLILATFVAGVQVGKYEPTTLPVPVSEVRQ